MYYFRERLHRAGKFFIWYGAETKQKLVLRTEILSYPEWLCGEDSYAFLLKGRYEFGLGEIGVLYLCYKVQTRSSAVHDDIIFQILFHIIKYIIMFFLIVILHCAYVALIISTLNKFNKGKLPLLSMDCKDGIGLLWYLSSLS